MMKGYPDVKSALSIVALVLVGTISGFAGLLNSAKAADFKYAVVDLQKALQSVDAGKKAKSTLEKEFNEKKKMLQTEEEALKKMADDLKKQSLALSDEAKARKQGEFQERVMKYRELFGKSQMDIQTRERELTEPIIGKLKTLVQELGESEGYNIIFERNENSVVFSQKKDDLTDKVIALFNKKSG